MAEPSLQPCTLLSEIHVQPGVRCLGLTVCPASPVNQPVSTRTPTLGVQTCADIPSFCEVWGHKLRFLCLCSRSHFIHWATNSLCLYKDTNWVLLPCPNPGSPQLHQCHNYISRDPFSQRGPHCLSSSWHGSGAHY